MSRLLLDAVGFAGALAEISRVGDELDAGYRSLSQGRMTEASSPPEYASTIFLGGDVFLAVFTGVFGMEVRVL